MVNALIVAVLVCGACAHVPPRVGVHGSEVLAHLDELGRGGSAELDTVVVDRGRERPGDRETVFLEQDVTVGGKGTRISRLVVGCGTFAAPQPCALAAHGDELIVLRTVTPQPGQSATHTNGDNPGPARVLGALTLASLGSTVLCAGLCESDKSLKVIALGGATLVLATILAIASGAHD